MYFKLQEFTLHQVVTEWISKLNFKKQLIGSLFRCVTLVTRNVYL